MALIYDVLRKDHEVVENLLEQLSAASTAEERRDVVGKIRDELVPHSRAEEAVFYNSLRSIDETKDIVAHSYQEHVMAEALLRGLQVTEAVALNWQSGVKKFSDDLRHHIAEEQGKVFTAAKKVLSEEEARMLGKAFKELKPKMSSGFMRSQLELMANLMPQRFQKSFLETDTGESHKKAS